MQNNFFLFFNVCILDHVPIKRSEVLLAPAGFCDSSQCSFPCVLRLLQWNMRGYNDQKSHYTLPLNLPPVPLKWDTHGRLQSTWAVCRGYCIGPALWVRNPGKSSSDWSYAPSSVEKQMYSVKILCLWFPRVHLSNQVPWHGTRKQFLSHVPMKGVEIAVLWTDCAAHVISTRASVAGVMKQMHELCNNYMNY